MPDNKVNNPQGKNQYTGKGGSSEPYRYSVGGYFATKAKQRELDSKASFSKKEIVLIDKSLNRNTAERDTAISRQKEYNQIADAAAQNALNSLGNLKTMPSRSNAKKTAETILNSKSIIDRAVGESEALGRTISERERAITQLSQEKSKNLKTIATAVEYKPVSSGYLKNLANQTVQDSRQITENIRKRMWGG